MIYKLKLIGFRLLLIAAMFSVMVNIAYAEVEKWKPVEVIYYEPDAELTSVLDHLVFVGGSDLSNVDFAVENNNDIGAVTFFGYSEHPRVSINQGSIMMSFRYFGNFDMVAYLVGHELGHVRHGVESKNLVQARNEERRADLFGIELIHKAGYDCRIAEKTWAVYIRKYGGKILSGVGNHHPSPVERLMSAKKECDSLKSTGHLSGTQYYEDDSTINPLDMFPANH